MDEGIRVTRDLTIPEGELEVRFSRSGGPGGQNVNRRETRVEVVFDVAGSPSLSDEQRARALRTLASRLDSDGRLRIVSSEERTQAQNRARAIERFADVMRRALRPPPKPRVKTKPTRAARERRLSEKRARSQVKKARARPSDE